MKNINISTKVITDGISTWEFTCVKEDKRKKFFISIYDIRVDENGQAYDLIEERRVSKSLGNKIYSILMQNDFFKLEEVITK